MRLLAVLLLVGISLAAGTPGNAGTLDKAKLQAQRQALQESGQRLAKVPASAREDANVGRVAAVRSASRAMAGRSATLPPDKIRHARIAAASAPVAGDADSKARIATIDSGWIMRSRPAMPPISKRK